MGYVGSPAFEVDLSDGERLEVDVIALPVSYTSFGVRHTTADPEGWLMLAPAGADKPPPRTVRALIRGHWLRYTVSLVALAALIATMFVFRTGTAAWWDSDTVLLLSATTLIYLRFGAAPNRRRWVGLRIADAQPPSAPQCLMRRSATHRLSGEPKDSLPGHPRWCGRSAVGGDREGCALASSAARDEVYQQK